MPQKKSSKNCQSSEDFAKVVCGRFPVLRKKPSKIDFVYSQAGEFANYVNDNVRSGSFDVVQMAMSLIEDFWTNGDETLKSALQCNFLEVLDLRSPNGSKTFDKMSPILQKQYMDAQNYIGTPYLRQDY